MRNNRVKETPQCVEDINEKRKRAKENHKGAQDFNTMIERERLPRERQIQKNHSNQKES